MPTLAKDWDRHVISAEEVARRPGFQALRESILARAEIAPGERVVDIGSGTGLLTLPAARRAERVFALDISPGMCEYLRAKLASAELENVEVFTASAVSLPLVEASATVVVSNYCFHHLSDDDKHQALAEVNRVMLPGGRLVFGDMMFRPGLGSARDRRVVSGKVRAILRKGPGGAWRLAKNVARYLTASWEKPVRPDWWAQALRDAGFVDVEVEALAHEGGIAFARKPA